MSGKKQNTNSTESGMDYNLNGVGIVSSIFEKIFAVFREITSQLNESC